MAHGIIAQVIILLWVGRLVIFYLTLLLGCFQCSGTEPTQYNSIHYYFTLQLEQTYSEHTKATVMVSSLIFSLLNLLPTVLAHNFILIVK